MQQGTATLFLLIIVLVSTVAFVFLYFGLMKPPVLPVSFRSLTPPANKPSSTPKTKFNTSKDQKLGLEFQYSSQNIVKKDSEEEFNNRGNGNYRKNFTSYVGYEPAKVLGAVVVLDKSTSYDTNPLTVWVFENLNDLSLDQWFNKYWYYPFLWGVFDYTSKSHINLDTEATLSGQPAKSKIVSYQSGKPKYIYVSINQKMYLFRLVGSEGESILSSVKFAKDEKEDVCQIAGCSGQLCVGKDEKNIVTTCIYSEKFACYKNARCEKQADGKCGWTQTDELKKCLQKN